MDSRIQRRYAPMNRDHIPRFPHKMPQVNWDKNLPIFQDEKVDDALLHLIKFHIHSWRLKVEWHEDLLMNIFMVKLEGKAREWYEGLNPSSLFSLKYFHKVFYENYKEYSPSLSLVENCCDQSEDLIQHLVRIYENLADWHPEDYLEEIHNFITQTNHQDDEEELI